MFLHQLVHLPVLLACSSHRLLQGVDRIPDARLHEYWLTSRTLMFRWCHQLRALKESLQATRGIERERIWSDSRFVLREVLMHELTTRLCSAILDGLDEKSASDNHCSVAQSVFCGQLDVRHRTLNLLVSAEGLQLPDLQHLNHDRRNLERWSDALLSLLPSHCPKRAYFSHPASEVLGEPPRGFATPEFRVIITTALAASIPAVRFQRTRNGALHRRVSDALLGCLRTALFDRGVQPIGFLHASLQVSSIDQRVDMHRWLPQADAISELGSPGALGRF